MDGLFSTPEEVRDQRIQKILEQQRADAPRGFNFGRAMGSGVGEAIGGIAGMSTKAENKAAELQAMMQSIDQNNPDDLAKMAKMLNELGYTKEAIAVLERRNTVISGQREEEKYKTEKAQGRTRTVQKVVMRPMQIGSGKDAQVVQVPMQVAVTQEWKNGAWVDIMPSDMTGTGASPYGGITVIDPKTGMATMKQGDPAVDGYKEDIIVSP